MCRILAFLFVLFSTSALATTAIWTNGQLKGTGLLHRPADLDGLGVQHSTLTDCDDLPSEFDLRDFGVVPPIKDQGQCGSCWSFSMTGSLESAYAAGSGVILDLSEQQIVSCDRSNFGCGGGNLNDFAFQIGTGQALETAFPYTGRNSACRSGLQPAAKGTSFAYVGASNRRATEKEVMCALYKSHTIPWITVSAGGGNWNAPPSSDDGVFSRCGSGMTNHAVGLIGWKTIGGKVYMKMRNSWGAWGNTAGKAGGQKGYALMPLGCDNLGEEVAYIMTDSMPCQPPKVKLPVETLAQAGVDVMLGVREQSGVDYEWFVDGVSVAHGAMAYFAPTATTVYKLVGKNACGTSESSSKITIIP